MDEPLSNLDAKLRVQMRAEIARIQHDLGVTTIYVTHDQIEAMTMGDRVAVMRKGVLQQVDTPQTLYDQPGQPVRRRVHRVAGHEPDRGDASVPDDGSLAVELGLPLPVPAEVLAQRPGLRAFRDRRKIILGIRPEDMEDASLVSDAPPERRIAATVELREALGSDVLVHFPINAPPAVTEDVELALDAGRARPRGGAPGRGRHDHRDRPPQPADPGPQRRADRARGRHPAPALLRPRGRLGHLRRGAGRNGAGGRHPTPTQPHDDTTQQSTTAKETHHAISAMAGRASRRDGAAAACGDDDDDGEEGGDGTEGGAEQARTPARST